MTGPPLDQHNFPYHRDETWFYLEERTVCQLWVGLFQFSIIKMRGRSGVSTLLFEARYVISNLVIDGTNPLQVNAGVELINRELKKRPSKWPILDLLHVCRVQERANELPVIFRSTGCGSLVILGVISKTWSAKI